MILYESEIEQIALDLCIYYESRLAKIELSAADQKLLDQRVEEVTEDDELTDRQLRPDWYNSDDDKGVIKIVMTGSASDPLDWQEHIRNKERRKALGNRLKDPSDPLRLLIVRDMFLTGFDAPCLHTMYVDKPMKRTYPDAVALHNFYRELSMIGLVAKNRL